MATSEQQHDASDRDGGGDRAPLAEPQDTVTGQVLRQKIWQRCNERNSHFVGCIVGREGSGKSYTALRIAELADASFSAERVFFRPERFLEALEADRDAGDVLILDEAGVGVGNRTWYEQAQILLNQTLQTIRDDNVAVLFTCPRLSELDSQSRGRLHALLEMTELEPGEYARLRWQNVDPARKDRDTIYTKYPRIRHDGLTHRVRSMGFTPPDDELAEAYEGRKAEFKAELYSETRQQFEDDEDGDEIDEQALADRLVEDGEWREYLDEHGGNGRKYIDVDLLRVDYPALSQRAAKRVKKAVQREVDLDA